MATAAQAPLVLLHGWGLHGAVWHGVQAALGRRTAVHAPDLPGYGPIPGPEPYDLEHLARTLAASFPGDVDLCGWSLGGQVALTWARLFPERVRRLVLVATTPAFTVREDWHCAVERGVLEAFAASLRQDYEGTLARFFLLQARGTDAQRATVAALRRMVQGLPQPPVAMLEAGLKILAEADLRTEAGAIPTPALLIQGDRDRLVPADAARWLARRLPHATLEWVHGSGHAPFISHLPQVVACMERFLA
ncbi:MAG: pimeloyl-ACP methyl ester esterase BioH [Betaproteobacteria bacterium]|nr:pimeloyl-ACP methyl ester esterase BioH [Betaproteobacteria bacterium]